MTTGRSHVFLAALCCLLAVSCGRKSGGWFSDPQAWYGTQTPPRADFVDVIYFVSTEVIESHNPDGSLSDRAVLSEEERVPIRKEMDHLATKVFSDSVNFFSPYYHQATLSCLLDSPARMDSVMVEVASEACQAFDYYMENLNGGRKFILAGFSQGAMLLKDIIRRMTDEQFSRMVCAYLIGEQITASDLENPRFVPASGALDKGVVVSFNSVMSPDKAWDAVCSEPACCMNPVNWRTDGTPAAFKDGDIDLEAAVDVESNVLVVSGYDAPPSPGWDAPWPEGCLHGKDIVLYCTYLGQNAKDRSYR